MKKLLTATPLMIVPVILYGVAAVAAGRPDGPWCRVEDGASNLETGFF